MEWVTLCLMTCWLPAIIFVYALMLGYGLIDLAISEYKERNKQMVTEQPFDMGREITRDCLNGLNRTFSKENPLVVDYDPNYKCPPVTDEHVNEVFNRLKVDK